MMDDDATTDHTTLNDAMRHAFRVTRVTGRPGMIRNTVNAAIRRAAIRDVSQPPGAGVGAQTWETLDATQEPDDARDDDPGGESRR
jgi:hypothetical protein